jgi:DNA-binding response OmpR family regulator
MDMKRGGISAEPGDHAVTDRHAGVGLSDGRTADSGGTWPDQVIRVGELKVDVARLEADLGHGRIPLTRLEFLFLQELIRHAGRSVSKRQLLFSVWGYENDPGSNVVGVCVRRLRTKLGDQLITTVRGQGYQLGVG